MQQLIESLFAQCGTFTLIDIGASNGLEEEWEKYAAHLRAILFEPATDAYEKLRAKDSEKQVTINAALGGSRGEKTLYGTRAPWCSSFFAPNLELLNQFPEVSRFDIVAEETVSVDLLDQLLVANNIADSDFIKIDTQGYELNILTGATKALDQVIGVKVEVEFIEIYKGQPLFGDVFNYLYAHGFELYDLNRVFWKKKAGVGIGSMKGQLVFADALFVKKQGLLCKAILSHENATEKAFRAILILLIYGYHDSAIQLLLQLKEMGLIDNLFWVAEKITLDRSRSWYLPIRGMGQLYRAVAFLRNRLRPHYKQWCIYDDNIGNT